MKIVFDFNKASLENRIKNSQAIAVTKTTEQIITDSNNYCPKDQTQLINSSIIHTASDKNICQIIWNTPYARYLYFGFLMVDEKTGAAWARKDQHKKLANPRIELKYSKDLNPNAGALWFEKAKDACNDNWRDLFEDTLRENI